MSTRLSLANLGAISQNAAVPGYQRSDLKAGIVHFGIGNFHRAHQAVYLTPDTSRIHRFDAQGKAIR